MSVVVPLQPNEPVPVDLTQVKDYLLRVASRGGKRRYWFSKKLLKKLSGRDTWQNGNTKTLNHMLKDHDWQIVQVRWDPAGNPTHFVLQMVPGNLADLPRLRDFL